MKLAVSQYKDQKVHLPGMTMKRITAENTVSHLMAHYAFKAL